MPSIFYGIVGSTRHALGNRCPPVSNTCLHFQDYLIFCFQPRCFDNFWFSWLCHLSRHCFAFLDSRRMAISPQFPGPNLSTSSFKWLFSFYSTNASLCLGLTTPPSVDDTGLGYDDPFLLQWLSTSYHHAFQLVPSAFDPPLTASAVFWLALEAFWYHRYQVLRLMMVPYYGYFICCC